jgi:glycine/D-amino acid oxidase-like deaminating enzyme
MNGVASRTCGGTASDYDGASIAVTTDFTDALVVGGGFYGLYLAEHLRARFDRVVVCEKQADFMQRASYANQARVHNGYHYPRSLLTALRSRMNYTRFVAEFPDCVDTSFLKIYAVAGRFSKVSPEQFRLFMKRIGAPIERAPKEFRQLFSSEFIDDVFLAEECAFNSVSLKDAMIERARRAGVELRTGTEVSGLRRAPGGRIDADLDDADGRHIVRAGMVFSCTYSLTNRLVEASGLEPLPLKHELAELCLVEVPDELREIGITIMCGPFFSCMPFPPAASLHTLSHVRYTPHFHWHDAGERSRDADAMLHETTKETAFPYMIRDAMRYVPLLAKCRYRSSLWEVKTILPRSEVDDSRPILFRPNFGIENHHVVIGGKIDNVFDAVQKIDDLLSGDGRIHAEA